MRNGESALSFGKVSVKSDSAMQRMRRPTCWMKCTFDGSRWPEGVDEGLEFSVWWFVLLSLCEECAGKERVMGSMKS